MTDRTRTRTFILPGIAGIRSATKDELILNEIEVRESTAAVIRWRRLGPSVVVGFRVRGRP